jgi:hypothetical protein
VIIFFKAHNFFGGVFLKIIYNIKIEEENNRPYLRLRDLYEELSDELSFVPWSKKLNFNKASEKDILNINDEVFISLTLARVAFKEHRLDKYKKLYEKLIKIEEEWYSDENFSIRIKEYIDKIFNQNNLLKTLFPAIKDAKEIIDKNYNQVYNLIK